MKRSIAGIGALLVAAALAAGCASMPPPTAKLASAAGAIRAAEELGAHEIPAAQLRLKYATDQYQAAKRLVDEGEHAKAERVLARAEADAELAVAIARQVQAEKAAIEAQRELQAVHTK